MIAVQEDASGNINHSNAVKQAFMSLGAGREEVDLLGSHRCSSFAMIGRKGAKSGSVPQVRCCPFNCLKYLSMEAVRFVCEAITFSRLGTSRVWLSFLPVVS